MADTPNPETFLRRKAVEARTGLSRASIYQLMSEGRFPKPVNLSKGAVAWLESEIAAWQEARIAERETRAGRPARKVLSLPAFKAQ